MTLGTLFTNLGYLTGAIVFILAARRDGRFDQRLLAVMLLAFAGGVIGAKLVQWALLGFPGGSAAWLDPASGGRTIIAGIICGWLAVEAAKWQLGIRRSTGDYFALALPAGEVVGRIGCYFNGCCYGSATTVPWAIYQHGELRHPAQLYASAEALLILLTLLLLRRHLWREGDLFRAYLLLYGVARFSLEFLRYRDSTYLGLSFAQWFSLELIVAGAVMLAASWLKSRQPRLAKEAV